MTLEENQMKQIRPRLQIIRDELYIIKKAVIGSPLQSTSTSLRLNADNVKANLDIIPASFNVAYMTSSDFVNGWIGAGVSYIFTQIRINEGVVPDSLLSFGHQEKDNKGVIAGDFFAGVEYIFTKNLHRTPNPLAM